jgi:hypothetical protein
MEDLVIYEVGVRCERGIYAKFMDSSDHDEAVKYLRVMAQVVGDDMECVLITQTYRIISSVPQVITAGETS